MKTEHAKIWTDKALERMAQATKPRPGQATRKALAAIAKFHRHGCGNILLIRDSANPTLAAAGQEVRR